MKNKFDEEPTYSQSSNNVWKDISPIEQIRSNLINEIDKVKIQESFSISMTTFAAGPWLNQYYNEEREKVWDKVKDLLNDKTNIK